MPSLTIKDIARKCGVSVTTVSRAINNHPDINEKTKERIMQVIKEYNYIPNNSARNLKRIESNTIAVLIKGITNQFFNKMLKVFEAEIEKNKYDFLLHPVEEDENEIDVAISLEKEKKLKGIIFLGGYFSHSVDKLKYLNVPFVLSTGGFSEEVESDKYSYVMVDDFKESYKIVDYLCKLGHRRIAIISVPESSQNIGKTRLYGYKKALQDNNIPFDPALVRYKDVEDRDFFSMRYGYEVAKELLQSNVNFSAIFAISDTIAVGACKAIFDSGGKVPEDYSVAGYDGIDIAHYYNPSITTIRQPVEEIARESIRILFEKLNNNKKIEKHKIFDGELIVGQSTIPYNKKS